ncbi:MAG: hypothetical protein K2M04_04895, partial [Muribaculaceae bacterium]|nr:hypothetical protein [Muribaculaceae bacterium]
MVRIIEDQLRSSNLETELAVEYLFADQWEAKDEEAVMRNFLKRARENKVDLIITQGDEAFYTMTNCGDSLGYEIPVVFFGIQFPDYDLIRSMPNVCGRTSERNYARLLKEAIATFPDRKEIILAHTDQFLQESIAKEITKEWVDNLKQRYHSMRLLDFQTRGGDIDNLIHLVSDEESSRRFIVIVPKCMSILRLNPNTPIYSCSSEDKAVLAFYDVDNKEAAMLAGQQAAARLKGETAASIGVTNHEPEFHYSYDQLMKFGADVDAVEARPNTFVEYDTFDRYQGWIIGVGVVLIILSLMAVVFFMFANRHQTRKRLKAEDALVLQSHLIKQRNQFDKILSTITDSLIMYDTSFNITTLNAAVVPLLGYATEDEALDDLSRKRAPGKLHLHVYVNTQDVLADLIEKARESRKPQKFPENAFMLNRTTHQYFPVSGEVVPVLNEDRTDVVGFIVIFRNVSEDDIQKRLLNIAAEVSSIYPWQYDISKNYLILSHEFYIGIGIPEQNFMTRTQFSQYVHTEDVGLMTSFLDGIREGSRLENRIAFRLLMAGGRYEWWEFSVSSVGSSSGMTSLIVGICQSVEYYKKVECDLKEARDRALQSDKLKSAFLANMSHEIRTPLNAIVGFSNLLSLTTDPDKKSQYAEVINRNNELLLQLINDVLDLAKVESNTLEFNYSKVDVNQLIRTVEDSVRMRVERGVVLNYLLGADRCVVKSDGNRLMQVLTNFLTNACKFTKRGSITFGYEVREREVYFFVKDTGKGIPENKLSAVFERFCKLDSFTQGTGLGLPICKSIIEKLSGQIGCTSRGEGKGSTFWFTIPYDPIENAIEIEPMTIDELQAKESPAPDFTPAPVDQVPAASVNEVPVAPVVETPVAPVSASPAGPVGMPDLPPIPAAVESVEPSIEVVEKPAAPVYEAPAAPVYEAP